MSDTPERIWIGELLWGDSPDPRKVEYVRADMHAAEIARLRAEIYPLRKEVDAHLRANSDLVDKLHAARAEQPRTDAEWKAADRKKRINDLAARYAGQIAGGAFSRGDTVAADEIVAAARALAAAVVEAEE